MSLKTKVLTRRLAESQAYYQRVFNLQVLEEWDEPGDRGVILGFSATPEQAMLELYHADETPLPAALSLQFRVDDLAGFIAGLPGDIERRGPTQRPWGSVYLYLSDPDGIPVIVYEGGL